MLCSIFGYMFGVWKKEKGAVVQQFSFGIPTILALSFVALHSATYFSNSYIEADIPVTQFLIMTGVV